MRSRRPRTTRRVLPTHELEPTRAPPGGAGPGSSRWLVFGVCAALFLLLALRFYDHTVDDAFISFRYARNLVDGHGLVFNPGERVEGYTNFLWVLCASLSLAASVDPELACRWVGLAASVASLAAAVRFGPSSPRHPAALWCAPALLAVSPAFAVWATGGLEAPLFAALIVWGTGLAAEGIERAELPASSAVLFGLAALARPEGAPVAVVVAGAALALCRRERGFWPRWCVWVGVFLAIVTPYLLWRWQYYGYPLPNTFYAKVGGSAAQFRRGLAYAHDWLSVTGYWILPIAAAAFLAARRRLVALLATAAGALAALVVAVGGDGLPMYRFFVPVLGPLALLVGWGVYACLERVTRVGLARAIAVAAIAAMAAYSALPAFRGSQYDYVQQDVREVGAWRRIGVWFGEHAKPGETIAVIPAGAIPYFSRLRAIDMLGLNDLHIAHRDMPELGSGQAGHEKYDVEYVLGHRPEYVIVGVYGLSPEPHPALELVRPFYPAERELLLHPGFAAAYRPETARTPDGHFAYFVREAR